MPFHGSKSNRSHRLYNKVLQRFLATVLLLLATSLSVVSPLLWAKPDEKELPACCRRDGKHHCAKTAGHSEESNLPGQHFAGALAACPMFPSGHAAPAGIQIGVAPALATSATAILPIRPAAPAATQACSSAPSVRPWQQRGPPSLNS